MFFLKKLLALFLVCMVFIMTGCPDKQQNKESDTKILTQENEQKDLKEFMGHFMWSFMNRDMRSLNTYFSKRLKTDIKAIPQNKEPHAVSYSLSEDENDSEHSIKVNVFSAYTGRPYFSVDQFTYTVVKEEGKLLIDSIKKDKSSEIYTEDGTLKIKKDNSSKGEKVIGINELPFFTASREYTATTRKYPVPQKSFGPCAMTMEGDKTAITTYDGNSYICIASKKQEEQTFAQGDNGGQEGGKQGGGSQEGSSGGGNTGENKSGEVTLKDIDYFPSERIDIICFSPEGKLLLTGLHDTKERGRLIIYSADDGERLKYQPENRFSDMKFSLTDPFFISEDELIFKVSVSQDSTYEEKAYGGIWKIDLKKKKIEQIESKSR